MQDRKPDEVIVALQSEDKKSGKFLKENNNKFNINLKLALTDKKGKIFQENAALRQTNGDIVCFIDDDAIARQDWLEKIEEWYIKDKKIGGVGGRDIVHQPDGEIDEKKVKTVGKITFYGRSIGNHHNITNKPQEVHYLKGCNMSYRSDLLDSIDSNLQGSDVIFEEQWIGLHIIKQGYKIIYDPQILVDHFPSELKGEIKRDYNKQRVFLRANNQIYILLSFFSLPRKLFFLFYTFFIGDSQNPGPGRLIISFVKKDFNTIWGFIPSSFRGKIKGLFTYHNQI